MRAALCAALGAGRGRDALRRRADPGARGRARLGRRGRAAAARLRPVAAGARRALHGRGRLGGPHPPARAAGLFPGASQRRRSETARPAPRFAGAQARRSSPTRRSTTGWSANWRTASTSPAAPRRSSSAARRAPSPAPARSRPPASATRRTTATASTTAAATCWAGATRPRSPRWRPRRATLETRLGELGGRIARLQARTAARCETRLEALAKLEEYRRLSTSSTGAASPPRWPRCRTRSERLESASDVLKQLSEQLQRAGQRRWRAPSAQLEDDSRDRRSHRPSSDRATPRRCASRRGTLLDGRAGGRRRRASSAWKRCAPRRWASISSRVESCDNREQDMRGWLQDAHRRRRQEARAPAREDHPGDARLQGEFKLDTAGGRRQHRGGLRVRATCSTQLQADDLPRFVARFKELLNENTIREVANFNSQLAPRARDHQGAHRAHQRVADPDRLQPRPLHRAGGAADARTPTSATSRPNCAPAPKAR